MADSATRRVQTVMTYPDRKGTTFSSRSSRDGCCGAEQELLALRPSALAMLGDVHERNVRQLLCLRTVAPSAVVLEMTGHRTHSAAFSCPD